MKELIALSLFDGMSCGQIALDKLGYPVKQYFACEIDKHAIKVSQTKWPGMIHLGSVVDVHAKDLPKIDIIIGGSPCQGFSNAGKGLNFNDSRSRLFFEFVRLYHECRERNPDVLFMLENVRMKKEWEDIISRILEIQPININSALVSAQNRERLYWTNIAMKKRGLFEDSYCSIPQPNDKFIFLKDILEPVVDKKYFLTDAQIARINRKGYSQPKINPDKTGTINTKNNSGQMSIDSGTTLIISDRGKGGAYIMTENKTGALKSHTGCSHDHFIITDPICVAMRGRNPDNLSDRTVGMPTVQTFEENKTGKTNCLTTVAKDNLVMFKETPNYIQWGEGGYDQDNRAYFEDGKSGTLDIKPLRQKVLLNKEKIRRLTPIECARLQTVPDGYFEHEGRRICSDSQIYRMCGNGWTVDVIAHIFSFMEFKSL